MRRRLPIAALIFLGLSLTSVLGSTFWLRTNADLEINPRIAWPRFSNPPAGVFDWRAPVPADWPDEADERMDAIGVNTRLSYQSATADGSAHRLVRYDVGWPFQALSWRVRVVESVRELTNSRVLLAMVRAEPVGAEDARAAGAMPDAVLWLGLLGDVFVHAWLWFFAWVVARAGVRRVRAAPRRWRASRRRFALVALLLLAGGFGLTVLLAWTTRVTGEFGATRGGPVVQLRQPMLTDWPDGAPEDWPRPNVMRTDGGFGWSMREWVHSAYATPYVLSPPGASTGNLSYVIHRYGFPFHALETHKIGTDHRGALHVPLPLRRVHALVPATLPRAPLWPGLLGGVLFWSVVLWVLVPLPRELWRGRVESIRRRRGLCIGCGYDIADLDQCPECGRDASAPLVRAVPSQL